VGETGGGVGGGLGGGVGHVLRSLLKYCCVFPLPPNCLASPLSNFRRLQPHSSIVEQVVPVPSEHCPDPGVGAGLGFGTTSGTGLCVGLLVGWEVGEDVGFMVGLKVMRRIEIVRCALYKKAET